MNLRKIDKALAHDNCIQVVPKKIRDLPSPKHSSLSEVTSKTM